VVVNTCAFIDAARQSQSMSSWSSPTHDARCALVVPVHGRALRDELRAALPEVDLVAGFGASLTAPSRCRAHRHRTPSPHGARFDLLACAAGVGHAVGLREVQRL